MVFRVGGGTQRQRKIKIELVTWSIEDMDGVAEFAFDGAVAVGGNDFSAVVFPHVKSINGGAFFGGNFGGDDIDVQFRELLRVGVQKTNAVFSFYCEEGESFRSCVME